MDLHVDGLVGVQVRDLLPARLHLVITAAAEVLRLKARLAPARLALADDARSDSAAVARRRLHLDRTVHGVGGVGGAAHRRSLLGEPLESRGELWVRRLLRDLPLVRPAPVEVERGEEVALTRRRDVRRAHRANLGRL